MYKRQELPAGQLSRALFDLERMQAQASITQNQTDTVVLEGTAPVSKMRNYQTELTAYTHGLGRLVCTFQGYQPCADQQALIEAIGYDCDGDLDFPADSVFCSHGAGFLVRYDEVEEHMHIEAQWHPQKTETIDSGYHHNRYTVDDAELKRVMERTHKPKEKVAVRAPVKRTEIPEHIEIQRQKPKTKCLLVDGYNMIHSWSELVPLAQEDLSAARDQLIQLLSSFQGDVYKRQLQQHRDSAGCRRVHSAVRLEAESDVRRGGDELKLRQRRFQRAAAEIVLQSAPGRTPGIFFGACRAGCRPTY